MRQHNPPHPGEILKEFHIKPLNLTITGLAEILGVSRVTVSEIVNCKNRITAEMAIRIAKAFSTTPEFWVNMQSAYDLWQALQKVNTDNIPVIYEPLEEKIKQKKKNVA